MCLKLFPLSAREQSLHESSFPCRPNSLTLSTRTGGFVGGDFVPVWSELRHQHRVLVMTAGMLFNKIEAGGSEETATKSILSDISLIVMDGEPLALNCTTRTPLFCCDYVLQKRTTPRTTMTITA